MTKFKAFRTLADGTREDWTDEFLAINAKKLEKLPAKLRIQKQKHVTIKAVNGPMAGHMLDLSMGHGSAQTLMFTMNGQTGFYAGGNWYALENLATDCPDAWRAWNTPAPMLPAAAIETPETAAPVPEIEPVAPVSKPIATNPTAPAKTAKAPAKRAACKQPTPADRMARRASARKRQLQRAIAGQLAPHLVAGLERCGLIRDGQPTRRGRFLYLDDATI